MRDDHPQGTYLHDPVHIALHYARSGTGTSDALAGPRRAGVEVLRFKLAESRIGEDRRVVETSFELVSSALGLKEQDEGRAREETMRGTAYRRRCS